MGWSFRESFKILPGVRLNFSRRGVGASIGPRGMHLGFGGGRAPRLTGGIGPLHYYRSLGAGRGEYRHPMPIRRRRAHFGLLAFLVGLIALVAAWFAGPPRFLNPSAPKPLPPAGRAGFAAHPTTVLPNGVPDHRRAPRAEPFRRREPPRDNPPR